MVRRNLTAASSRIANRSQACGQLLLMGMNDSEIIERSAHEPEVFGAIFDRHFDAIAGFCIRRVGNTDGEDIAGNVFRWAFENRERFDLAHGDARPWLFGIANNLVREARRSAGRQKLAYDRWTTREVADSTEIASQVAEAVDAQRDLSIVFAVLNQQPIEDVETLLLYAWEQLTYAEIAEALAVPIGTVRSRIHRVRRHIEEVPRVPLLKIQDPNYTAGGSV
jgi:RNA polymerase sigma factor (sigma-70 family)